MFFKSTRAKILFVAVLAVAGLGAGCGGGGGGGGDPISQSWYNVYGSYCGSGMPRPGCNFYWNGDKIVDIEDPDFGYSLTYDLWGYYDSYGIYRFDFFWGWQSPTTNIIYDEFGRALNKKNSKGYDDIGDVAIQKESVIENVAQELSVKLELAYDKAYAFSKTLDDYNQKGRTGRTEKDMKDATYKAFNVNYDDARAALEELRNGNSKPAAVELKKAAAFWGKTPAEMYKSLSTLYSTELEGLKIDEKMLEGI